MKNINGEPGVDGRGNIANTTINLPRIGLLANKDIDKAKEILLKRLEEAKDSLLYRKDILKKLKVKDLPFAVGQKLMRGSDNLSDNDTIEPILEQGTWGLGYIGLAEMLVALIGKHHGESEEARNLGYEIVSLIREKADEYTQKYKMNFSCYATPAEGLSSKFTDSDIKKFGIIEGVTDKKFYTNSFHVPVNYPISIMEKLKIEAPFHKLSSGGFISYVELDDYPDGEYVEKIIRTAFTTTNIGYIGINFHVRYCKDCGTYLHGEDRCPNDGSTNIQGISRVTGYLSLDERFGPGKTKERAARVDHNAEHHQVYDMI